MNPILLDIPNIVETERLHLRSYQPGDGKMYYQMLRQNVERCGFRYEGRQRQRHRKKNGEVVDRLWYGLLRSEWQNASPQGSE